MGLTLLAHASQRLYVVRRASLRDGVIIPAFRDLTHFTPVQVRA